MEVALPIPLPDLPPPPLPEPRPPRTLSREQVRRLVCALGGTPRLAARLIYGGGLRAGELVRLRLGDLDLVRARLRVCGAGATLERETLLPPPAIPALERLLEAAARIHARDLARDVAGAPAELRRGWLFPDPLLTRDRRTGRPRRAPLDPRRIERPIARAARALGLPRGTGARTLRRTFAAHLLEAGWSPDRVRELLGHHRLTTATIPDRVLAEGRRGVRSLLGLDSD